MERLTERSGRKNEACVKANACATCLMVCMDADSCEKCSIQEVFEKLCAYEDLEERELLVRLPCKVGDTLYYLNGKFILGYEVTGFSMDCTGTWLLIAEHHDPASKRSYGYSFDIEKIGKTVFFTREEAEAALQKMVEGGREP